ncbi:hypothetical protein SISSUDRAFT_1044051 [Sistotremastrum suecicum HHB10207 ss-3]|uniref:Ribosomal protein L27 n=1 Tax=Sistotremastrum suecicum HHB10207 ss-3 TaxID=1314776 RepID=A0A166FDC1_9AGAM|nr:hypothetical protein SISSUDRAFT_1044051 [Sistotremastrum suecicum HHB10207 ss-3]
MFATLCRLSKASRRPLTPKRGNKDFYKGTGAASLPGGHRTGAPGKYKGSSHARYELDDTKVRVFIAPPLAVLNNTELKPYVHVSVQKPRRSTSLSSLPSTTPSTPDETSPSP